MLKNIKLFIFTGFLFFCLDFIWIRFIALPIYTQDINYLNKDMDIYAALIFYKLYISGIVYFVLIPNMKNSSIKKVGLNGFFFGLIAYGTFALTNKAILIEWSWLISSVDMLWGGLITMIVSVSVWYLFRRRNYE